jgi:hypothetical protein
MSDSNEGSPCACGCGAVAVRGDFAPGHDQRAIHDRIRKVGTVREFIEWFDRTWTDDTPR